MQQPESDADALVRQANECIRQAVAARARSVDESAPSSSSAAEGVAQFAPDAPDAPAAIAPSESGGDGGRGGRVSAAELEQLASVMLCVERGLMTTEWVVAQILAKRNGVTSGSDSSDDSDE